MIKTLQSTKVTASMTKTPKSLRLIKILNWIFKIFVYYVFIWILVAGLSQIQIPNLESSMANGNSGSGGIGFVRLGVYLSTWKVFRNFGYWIVLGILSIEAITYFVFAKENPTNKNLIKTEVLQTVKYVGLLLFSYALAGLAVDLVYVAYFISRELY